MSTVLRQFPEISRQGHQETTWSGAIPAGIRYLELQGIASDAVLSNTANAIDFTISVSPDGVDANPLNKIIFIEPWHGGTHQPHGGGAELPNIIDITFGPLTEYVGWRCKLAVDIPLAMVVGGAVLVKDVNNQ